MEPDCGGWSVYESRCDRVHVFESASDRVVGYTKFYREGIQRTAIPAVREVNTSNIYIPHVASDAQWRTELILVNTTSAPVEELIITFNNGENRQFSLDAGEHRAFDIAGLFDNEPQPDIQSAVITNANGIIGVELFGRTDDRQMDGILLTGKAASTVYYPTWPVVSGGPALRPITHRSCPCTITITPYDAKGPFSPA